MRDLSISCGFYKCRCRFVSSVNRYYHVTAVQKVLSGSGRAGRLRLMGKYIGHRLVARLELDNTFWTDSTEKNVPTWTSVRCMGGDVFFCL